jgi:hypothetical protein
VITAPSGAGIPAALREVIPVKLSEGPQQRAESRYTICEESPLSDTAEIAAVDAPANTGSGTSEIKYPKVISRGEEASIVHYAPTSHNVPDPSTRS